MRDVPMWGFRLLGKVCMMNMIGYMRIYSIMIMNSLRKVDRERETESQVGIGSRPL